jgi:hypothetical protein
LGEIITGFRVSALRRTWGSWLVTLQSGEVSLTVSIQGGYGIDSFRRRYGSNSSDRTKKGA